MTTQAVKLSLIDTHGTQALEFEGTATDDTWTEITDSVNSLSLYKVLRPGAVLIGYIGYYTAGAGMFRIRNTQSQQVKVIEALNMIKGQRVRPMKPVVVQDKDILEVFTTVAGS